MSNSDSGMEPKTVAIIAHVTIIGWIVALVLNNQNRSKFTTFHIRQLLGIYITGIICSLIPFIGLILSLAVLAMWIFSLVNTINDKEEPIPIIGDLFQDIFKSL